jgi:hypothetical protein
LKQVARAILLNVNGPGIRTQCFAYGFGKELHVSEPFFDNNVYTAGRLHPYNEMKMVWHQAEGQDIGIRIPLGPNFL